MADKHLTAVAPSTSSNPIAHIVPSHDPLSAPSRPPDARKTKSRTGCRTCKKKRLKCDERKPTCEQCERRKVPCEGYAKEFKWKPFAEQRGPESFNGPSRPRPPNPTLLRNDSVSSVTSHTTNEEKEPPPTRNALKHSSEQIIDASKPGDGPVLAGTSSRLAQHSLGSVDASAFPPNRSFAVATSSSDQGFLGPRFGELPTLHYPLAPQAINHPLTDTDNKSPRDPLVFGEAVEWTQPPQGKVTPGLPTSWSVDDEIAAKINIERYGLTAETVQPEDDETRVASSRPGPESPQPFGYHFPMTDQDEAMLRHFSDQTCAALTVFTESNGNPWRELLVPLIPSCAPLYHATAAMTSFQVLRNPQRAMFHMNACFEFLGRGYKDMSYELAIATHLCLSLAETWNPLSPNSGHTHVQAARHLIRAAFDGNTNRREAVTQSLRHSKLLRFLCKTFVYLDVTLRLTSVFSSDANDFESIMASIILHGREDTYVDPLMGCASSLFPVLGHVANLVQKVCQTESTSPEALRQAVALQVQLEAWQPPIQVREAATSSVDLRDCLELAEAYKSATLLHLHQGVPEMPSRPAEELAKRTLQHLGRVKITSKATFVQIYPLLVAGSEAEGNEARGWVRQRLKAMCDAMSIGCVLASARVAEEVWKRRDRARMGYEHQLRSEAIAIKPSAYMARGELHWLRVLADWNWQVLLG